LLSKSLIQFDYLPEVANLVKISFDSFNKLGYSFLINITSNKICKIFSLKPISLNNPGFDTQYLISLSIFCSD